MAGSGWYWDHLRKVIDDQHQKQQTMRVLTVAPRCVMMKGGGKQQCNNQPMMQTAKAGGCLWQDCLRAKVDDWWKKWPATRALMVALQHAMTKRAAAADNNATTNQWQEQQRGCSSWCQDHLRKVVDERWQKRPATRVSTVAQWRAMTKAGGRQWHNNQPTTGAAKCRQGLVKKLPEDSDWQLDGLQMMACKQCNHHFWLYRLVDNTNGGKQGMQWRGISYTQ